MEAGGATAMTRLPFRDESLKPREEDQRRGGGSWSRDVMPVVDKTRGSLFVVRRGRDV